MRRYKDDTDYTRGNGTAYLSETWGDLVRVTLHIRRRPYRLVQRFGVTERVTRHWTWPGAEEAFGNALINADALVATVQNGIPIPVSYPDPHRPGVF